MTRLLQPSDRRTREPGGAVLQLFADESGRCPDIDIDAYDILLTSHQQPERPWVRADDVAGAVAAIDLRFAAYPEAAGTLAALLRDGEASSRAERLTRESLAYSALQHGPEFARWLARRPRPPALLRSTEPVRYERDGDAVTLTLADPASRNAYSAGMRDALIGYLDTCLADPSRPTVELRGDGTSFCTGGALDEFGLARDPAAAHLLRMETSAVTRLWELGDRAAARVHGPVIGSGIEIAAATAHLRAHPASWFQLPELAMGLLPGAGGTVTIVDRIGRHRAAWLMIGGKRIRAPLALAWGLIDAIGPA